MPTIYKRNCKNCNKYYESPNKLYCSRICRNSDKELHLIASEKRKERWRQGNRWNISAFLKAGSDATRGKPNPKMAGDKSPTWKGDKVSYAGIHKWVAKNFGRPKECTNCLTNEAKRYEWANISSRYKRERDDWVRLCVKCHRQMDAGHFIIVTI